MNFNFLRYGHLFGVSAALLVSERQGDAAGAEWSLPTKAPLLTRWARQVSPTNVLPEYPRPQMVRDQWQNLNGLWDYAITAKTQERPPADWAGSILVPYPIESALSGVMKPLKPDQRLWYRRTLTIPEGWKDQTRAPALWRGGLGIDGVSQWA